MYLVHAAARANAIEVWIKRASDRHRDIRMRMDPEDFDRHACWKAEFTNDFGNYDHVERFVYTNMESETKHDEARAWITVPSKRVTSRQLRDCYPQGTYLFMPFTRTIVEELLRNRRRRSGSRIL